MSEVLLLSKVITKDKDTASLHVGHMVLGGKEVKEVQVQGAVLPLNKHLMIKAHVNSFEDGVLNVNVTNFKTL